MPSSCQFESELSQVSPQTISTGTDGRTDAFCSLYLLTRALLDPSNEQRLKSEFSVQTAFRNSRIASEFHVHRYYRLHSTLKNQNNSSKTLPNSLSRPAGTRQTGWLADLPVEGLRRRGAGFAHMCEFTCAARSSARCTAARGARRRRPRRRRRDVTVFLQPPPD